MRSTFTLAYHSVLSSWKSFLAHYDGKPVIHRPACSFAVQ